MEDLTPRQARLLKERNRLALAAVLLAAAGLTAALVPLDTGNGGAGYERSYCVVDGSVACAVGVHPPGTP
ncbi:hypothetical protein GCM10009798_06110 [Nocardioides panacihumi]|uniref:Uncharacterized protein n=1 Tax=Nocardioides panacihumi TaxID=400774 RepID=A0ABN2QD88_9ACTN